MSEIAKARDRTLTREEWVDAEVERIMAMTDAELRAELTAQGEDPDAMARDAERIINEVIAAYLRRQGRLS